jgi:hypothetical protein
VSDGVRRYHDAEGCLARGSIDGPPADVCRSKGQLFDHFENALAALRQFYALEEHGFAVDIEAGEEAIRQACADRRSGEGIEVITEALGEAITTV